jgi:hypothetical protein
VRVIIDPFAPAAVGIGIRAPPAKLDGGWSGETLSYTPDLCHMGSIFAL